MRLIRVEPAEDDPNQLTADDKKIDYEYDYLGRRVRKAVYAWDPNAADWSSAAELDLRFMYHERKLLLELDGLDSLAKVRKYVWGPGPSPKRQRGSRLDHLLAIGDDPNSVDYIAFHDGAGNLGQIAKRSDGTLVAKYDFNGRVRAEVIGECEDPNSLDDCDQCGPCFFGYGLRGDGSFYLICGCGPSHDHAGTGCTGTGCGFDPPGSGGYLWGPFELVPADGTPCGPETCGATGDWEQLPSPARPVDAFKPFYCGPCSAASGTGIVRSCDITEKGKTKTATGTEDCGLFCRSSRSCSITWTCRCAGSTAGCNWFVTAQTHGKCSGFW